MQMCVRHKRLRDAVLLEWTPVGFLDDKYTITIDATEHGQVNDCRALISPIDHEAEYRQTKSTSQNRSKMLFF